MKTYNDDVVEKDMILFKINKLNRDSLRIYSEAENLSEKSDRELGQLEKDLKQFRMSLVAVGRSIRQLIRGSERGALVFLQAKGEVLSDLHRIQSNLKGIEGILNPNSSLYN